MSQVQTAAQAKVINGVDVEALIGVVNAIQADPRVAKFQFRASNHWTTGARSRTSIKTFSGALQEHRTKSPGFTADIGEPPVLLGEDNAPNPGEWLLHTLLGCIVTSTAYHAAARGIEISTMDSTVEGDIDLRGFLGLAPERRKGYDALRVTLKAHTKAKAEDVKACGLTSPMLEMISKAAPVTFDVVTY
jgi:uncharacterized OsmC-like protein